MEVEGESDTHHVMLKDFQKHPVSRDMLHADFYVVSDETTVEIEVPVRLEGVAPGVAEGGRLRRIRRRLLVRCTVADIPEAIVLDVSHLGMMDGIMVHEIEPPEGIELLYDAHFAVADVTTPRGLLIEEEEEEEELEEGEVPEGEEGEAAEGEEVEGEEAAEE